MLWKNDKTNKGHPLIKNVKRTAALLVSALSVVALAACSFTRGGEYQIYTNMDEATYIVTSDRYTVAGTGGEATRISSGTPAEHNASFTTRSKLIYAMDTSASLVVSADFSDEDVLARYTALCGETERLLEEIEISLSAFSKISTMTAEGGSIYAFNESEAGAAVEIDETAYDVLTIAKQMYEWTEGYYNPAVYYSAYAFCFYGLYGFMTEENLPRAEDIAQYRDLASHFGEVELIAENGAYYAVKPDVTVTVGGEELAMKIDLGGIGKGYAVDRVNALMEEYGFSYGYFNFGTSSIAVKNHYRNGSYKLGMTDPRSATGTYLQVNVSNECLSSSGDYEKYYEIDGVRYCHVIDPTTGSPVRTGIMTATVIGGSAAENDALTTAIMAMGKDRAVAFIAEKLTDRRVVFTYDESLAERT